jgi:hypothetical protein
MAVVLEAQEAAEPTLGLGLEPLALHPTPGAAVLSLNSGKQARPAGNRVSLDSARRRIDVQPPPVEVFAVLAEFRFAHVLPLWLLALVDEAAD